MPNLTPRFGLIAAIAVVSAASRLVASGSSPVLVGVSRSGSNQPRSSTWNGSSWSASAALPSVGGEAQWVVTRNCPTRNETLFACLDGHDDVNAVFYNGTVWGSVTELCTNAGQNTYRGFDAAYEQQSGDLLIAYWNESAGVSKIGFRTYSGGSISAESTLNLSDTNTVRFLSLTPKPNSDEILLLALNSNKHLYAAVWNGSAWGSVTTLETNMLTSNTECFAAAYETYTGDLLVVYSESGQNTPRYRTYIGGTWSSEMSAPTLGSTLRWARLVSDPGSNRILFGMLDSADAITMNEWSGSAWGSNNQLESTSQAHDRRCFDVVYDPAGSDAVAVYAAVGSNSPRFRRWTGYAWSIEESGPDCGDLISFVKLMPGTSPGEVIAMISNNSSDLKACTWEGYGLSSLSTIETSLGGSTTTEAFMLSVPPLSAMSPASVPYSCDFQGAVGNEWSPNSTLTNTTLTTFAGRYNTWPLRLALNTTPGSIYNLEFDFYALDSWDGNNTTYGPDRLVVQANENEVFNYTVAANDPTEGMTYSYAYDQIGAYGYGSYNDAILRCVHVSFTANSSVTTLRFHAAFFCTCSSFDWLDNESMGIDNVSVTEARFVDVTVARAFDVTTSTNADSYGGGMHWADLDNDGDLDCILTGNSSAKLLVNDTAGKGFNASTFGGGNVSCQGALLDSRNNGSIDFWAAYQSSNNTEKLYQNNGSASFTDAGSLGFSSPSTNEGVAAGDVNGDGWCDVVMFSGNGNWMGHNQGGSSPTFVGTSASSYGLNSAGDYGDGDYVSAGDVNNDKNPDFFYNYGSGKLFVSNGDGTYTRNNYSISVTFGGKVGSAWGDYDNDGDLDLYVPRLTASYTGTLWRNDRNWSVGTGSFTDVTTSSGAGLNSGVNYIPALPGARSCCWGDYDNDGYLDLFVLGANGNSFLYHNEGNGTFKRKSEGINVTGVGIDCVFVDFDNDGDLDLAVTRENAPAMLFENRTDNTKYLKVRVLGAGAGKTNKAAIGTRVELWNSAGTTLLGRRDIGVARGFGGTEPMWAHFGGITNTSTYQVKVYFLSGTVTKSIVPASTSTTIGSTTIPQMLTVQEASRVKVVHWSEVRNKAS